MINKTKVAFVLPHFDLGGVERVVLNYLLHLDPAQIAVNLILRERRGKLLPKVPDRVPVYDLGGVAARFCAPRLARVLRTCEAQVVYGGTNAMNLAVVAALHLMARPRPRLVVSEHTTPESYFAVAKWRWLRIAASRLLYRQADAVAVPEAGIGTELANLLNGPLLPIAVLPNPVYPATIVKTPPPTTLIDFTGPVLMAAGRLAPEKGFDLLINAFAQLSERHADTRLLILGEGKERPVLESLVQELGLGERVLLPGFVERPLDYFPHALAVVVPSRREGFGNTLVEAMAVGTPVIATDCPGPRAILGGGKVGLLVPVGEVEALAKAMSQLLEEPQQSQAMAVAGRQRVRQFEIGTAVARAQVLFMRLASLSAIRRS